MTGTGRACVEWGANTGKPYAHALGHVTGTGRARVEWRRAHTGSALASRARAPGWREPRGGGRPRREAAPYGGHFASVAEEGQHVHAGVEGTAIGRGLRARHVAVEGEVQLRAWRRRRGESRRRHTHARVCGPGAVVGAVAHVIDRDARAAADRAHAKQVSGLSGALPSDRGCLRRARAVGVGPKQRHAPPAEVSGDAVAGASVQGERCDALVARLRDTRLERNETMNSRQNKKND